MAEVIVSSLLLKLANFLVNEAITLYKVNDKLKFVERELSWIYSFLKDADAKSTKGDNIVQKWVKDVREVSFFIEDAIDTFLIEVESLSIKEPGILNKMKRAAKRATKLVAIHNLDSAINEIQARFKEINESRVRYDIKELGQSNSVTGKSTKKPIPAPDADEIDLVGFDYEKKIIIKLLLDENTSRRSVVSIVGQGGLGKTTLAEKIYHSFKEEDHFDVVIWLTVSQECKPITLLNKMLEKVNNVKFGENEHDEEYYITECKKSLKNRRYIIFLDDVWEDDLWSQIQAALPNDNIASRVLITTRFRDIAKAAGPGSNPCELLILNEDNSLKLLLKKASVETCPADLLAPAKELSKQCGGLPLALVVVGGLLSTKQRTPHAWNLVVQTMDWQKEGKKCMDVLASSYEDLPVHLKTCFIYLASFPEDYVYEADLLIRLWIAERFIPHDAPGTMKEIGETYLEELAQRCMIRVTKTNRRGSIEEFRVHDLLLNFAIHEAKEKNFLIVFSKQNNSGDTGVSQRGSFRLDDSSSYNTSSKYININVHTLFFFRKVVPFEFQFKLLRVLVICDYKCQEGEEIPHWINNLKRLLNLRCLVFRDCYFGELFLAIDNFQQLRTLEIYYCGGIFVHITESRYKTMENLITNDIGIVIEVKSASIPNHPFIRTYKSLPEKPCLSVTIKTHCWEQGFARAKELIQSHPENKPKYVTLIGRTIPILEMFDMISSLYFPGLNLYLRGELPTGVELHTDMIPPLIFGLKLSRFNINHYHMEVLGSSLSIRSLGLYEGSYNGKQMIYSGAQCFPFLIRLEICLLEELEELRIEDGAMPRLEELKIYKCPELLLPELQHLKNLRSLNLEGIQLELRDTRVFQSFQHLPTLIVHGRWQFEVVALNAPPHLFELQLLTWEVDEDSMPLLEKLQSLKLLI